MAQLRYERLDQVLRLSREQDGSIVVRTVWRYPDGSERASDSRTYLRLGSQPGLLGDWARVAPFPQEPYQEHEIHRFVIECDEPELAGFDFERLLDLPGRTRSPVAIVRSMPLCPLDGAVAVTPPLRIVQCDSAPGRADLKPMLDRVFGQSNRHRVPAALQLDSISLTTLAGRRQPAAVIHVWHMPVNAAGQLDATRPTEIGTLGWALAIARSTGCKLFVFHAASVVDQPALRQLAHAITARSGPAVIVLNDPPLDVAEKLYANLVHDFPLDRAASQAGPQGACSLFAGGGREETLRVSRYGQIVFEFAQRLLEAQSVLSRLSAPASAGILNRAGLKSLADERALSGLREFASDWPSIRFEDHESEGMLPSAERLSTLGLESAPATFEARVRPRPFRLRKSNVEEDTPPAAEPDQSRHVNMTLWRGGGERPWSEVPQRGGALTLNELVHLRVDIGRLRKDLLTAGSVQFNEQGVAWERHEEETDLEFAVTGLDFDVVGDPVRLVKLGRRGDTEPVYFGVIPRHENVCRLRLCIYHRQNLVQSFRLAVIVEPFDRLHHFGSVPFLLAKALGFAEGSGNELYGVAYLAAMEYSLIAGGDVNAAASRPERTLSLFMNDHHGSHVVTLKGRGSFAVGVAGDVDTRVEELRTMLRALATYESATGEEYAFFQGGVANRGRPDQLAEAMLQLAPMGWALYTELFANVLQREQLEGLLAAPGDIHVAHELVEHVLPWAALYDRYYDADAAGPHEACTGVVGLPRDELLKLRCGEHATCPLHADRQSQREGGPIRQERVVCPLHFWGFKHVVEIPLQQVGPNGAMEQHDHVLAASEVQLAVGLHEGLELAQSHVQELAKLESRVALNTSQRSRRDDVVDLMANRELDLIYFYCHARGGEVSGGSGDERLEFKVKSDAAAGFIRPSQFRPVPWEHHPLVFINGCHSAGFSPRALSPFVRGFRGQQASGVIGTEVDVWEPLATEVAAMFFARFLSGTKAGEALRDVRLQLLRDNNPLGLVYTLYAPAHLSMTVKKGN